MSLPGRDAQERTELHRRLQIRTAESNHDGIGVTIDDGRVVVVAVCSVVATLDLLRSAGAVSTLLAPHMRPPIRTLLVISIICRPYAVVDMEIGRQGSLPIVAPVKPYTELAEICIAHRVSIRRR